MTTFESGLQVFGGDIVYASDYAALVASLPKTYRKDLATPRSSTITLDEDPELDGIPLGVGAYDIELIAYFTVANTTPKLKTRWGFTGTITNTLRLCHGPGANNVGGPEAVSDATMRAYALSSQDAIYNTSTSSAYSAISEIAYGVEVTVAGNLSLLWAQSVSNASAVTVREDSAFRVRKIR
ncbi:hypothetical protein Ait01nite_089350 [Actinoplanes italicus]|uniref:Uncharacterized protein n=1 Tax=Actinoplanes italicus TaxID=113567 RepID=A0A2T0JIG1_9ACTN|nr:hypothetical protein [Actinoplanes italicus]PRX07351.1 hypothetical protein CLV67_14226 [Actinoplanes italicus]GIE35890.1 hypothetical protein Ait01nite_089350 [Actinoplanes italicus]